MLKTVEVQSPPICIAELQVKTPFSKRYAKFRKAGGILSPQVCSSVWGNGNGAGAKRNVNITENEWQQVKDMAAVINRTPSAELIDDYARLSQMQLSAIQEQRKDDILVRLTQQMLFDQALLLRSKLDESELFREAYPNMYEILSAEEKMRKSNG